MRASPVPPLDERSFYLDLFRGEYLVLAALDPRSLEECRGVATALAAQGARVVLVSRGEGPEPGADADVVGIWRELARGAVAVRAVVDPAGTASAIAGAGRVHKLVLVGAGLVLRSPDGARRSFVDVAAAGLPGALARVVRPLYAGVQGINLVEPGGIEDELFTYAGSGTLLSLGDYGEVRALGFSDYQAMAALVRSGCDLGYLRPRSEAEIEDLLPRAIGFFVAGSHPAGVVAIAEEPYAPSGLAEVEALFAVSRFHGEGVGRRLVEGIWDRALERGLEGLFAVTTSEEAAGLFRTCGFVEVGPEALPDTKWAGYPAARRERARCFLRT